MIQGRVHVPLLCAVLLASCSAGSESTGPSATTDVRIVPSAAQLQPGQEVTFSAGLPGTADSHLVWRVAEAEGGNIVDKGTAPVATAPAGANMLQSATKLKGQGTYTAPGRTGTYHVVATSSTNQTATDVAIVTVAATDPTTTATPAPAPTLSSFDAVATSIIAGQSTTLTWSVSGATSVRIDPGVGDVTGSASTIATPSTTTTYTLTASGSGSVSATVMVTVTPATAAQAVGAEFFVATTGSDSNPGTLSAPFATLDRAQAAVRTLKSAGLPASGVAVTLRGGVYRRSSTLLLTSADSGTVGSPVIWRSYPGETVRITGGRNIGGWTTVTSSDPNWSRIRSTGVFRADIGLTGAALMQNFVGMNSTSKTAAGDPSMNGIGISSSAVPFQGDEGVGDWLPHPHPQLAELIYDGTMMKLARWPKRSDDPSVSTSWVGATPGASATQFTSDADVTSRGWSVDSTPDLDKPWAHIIGGGHHDAVVEMTAASGTSIATAQADPEGIDGANHQGRWAAVNVLEELTDVGEYWIDRTNGVAYFKPGMDPTGHETVVSELAGPLVWTDATSQYLVFDGLTLEATQSILMRIAGPHITVTNSTFRNAGGSAILVGNGYAVIDRSKFYDLVGSGVVLVGVDVQYMPSTGSSYATVTNSEFYRVARYAQGRVPAIMMGGGAGHVVAHNYIHDVPNMGVYMLSLGATVEYNVFQRTGLHGFDHAAVYAWNNQNANSAIRYNIFRDVRMNTTYPAVNNEGYLVAGIYCDDYTTGYTTYSNVFYDFIRSDSCPTCNATPTVVNKTTSNSFTNSIFSDVSQIYYGSAGGAGGGSYMSNDQAWNVSSGFPSGAVSTATANPNFANPAAGNFSNQPDGTTLLVNGTEPIPAALIGIGH